MTQIKDLTGKLRPIQDLWVGGVDPHDYPDFSDAFIESAYWGDTGEPLTDDELNSAGEQLSDLVHTMAMEKLI